MEKEEKPLNQYGEIIMDRLNRSIHNISSELNSLNSYTFLVAVVLSAQTTDKAVNKATYELFKIADNPISMLQLGADNLKEYIKHLGLFNSKAKHILELSKILIDKYQSKIPIDRIELEKLPGVGRKTANVVLNHLYKLPYIAVDTHVKRVSNRLNLSRSTNPIKIEEDLYKILPKKHHINASNLLVMHGRYTCTAKKPNCQNCIIKDICCNYVSYLI